MYTYVICSPFVEHPVLDIAQFDGTEFDITIFEDGQPSNFLNKGSFNKELYCKCLLRKLFTISKSKIKPFIQYKCDKMKEPIIWLNKFEKLIDLNRELFNSKEHLLKFEKALMIIEVLRDTIEHQVHLPINRFDINQVKSKLKEYPNIEDKLSYLCEMETDYKQLRPVIYNSGAVPFDEQISLEIEKLNKQEVLIEKSKQRAETLFNSGKLSVVNKQVTLQLNCNINYFVDVFFQLSHDKQAIANSLKEISEFIANFVLDKDGNPISADSVYTMLKPSNFDKRPKGNSRFKLE